MAFLSERVDHQNKIMRWEPNDLIQFFGNEPKVHHTDEFGATHVFHYQGSHLKYEVWVGSDMDSVIVSCDDQKPLSGFSLFDISIPCGRITLSTGLPTDGLQIPEGSNLITDGLQSLDFYHGGEPSPDERTLSIIRRADGELSVSPVLPYPANHPLKEIMAKIGTDSNSVLS